MHYKTTLALLCTSLFSVLNAAPQDAAAVYRSLAAPPAKVGVNISIRAEVYPALEFIPADAEAFIALNDFTDKAAALLSSPIVKAESESPATPGPFDDSDIAELTTSFAIGVAKGSAQTFSVYQPVYTYLESRREGKLMANSWSESAADDYADTIRDSNFSLSRSAAAAAILKVKSATLKPIYTVLRLKYEAKHRLPKLMNACIEASRGPGAESVSINGYKGWKYNFAALLGEIDTSENVGKQVKAITSAKSVYHLYKVQDNAIIMVICENPAEIKLSNNVETSVLSDNKMAFCDSVIRRNGVALAYVSPELLNVCFAYSNTGINIVSEFASNAFKLLSSEHTKQAMVFNSAARGSRTLGSWLTSFSPTKNTKPLTLVSWRMPSGATHIRVNRDACGAKYAPGTIALSRMGASSKTIFYTETTPFTAPVDYSTPDLITAAAHVYGAVDSTMAESSTGHSVAQLSSRVQSTMTALKNVNKTFGTGSAFVVFNVKGSPHASYYNTYKDIKALTKAAERLSSSAGALFGVKMKKHYKVTKGAKATSISISLPETYGAFKSNVLMTTDRIAIGTVPALNNLVLKSATGKTPFSGSVYSVRPSALASMAGAAAAVDPSVALFAGMAGAVLGNIGDIYAADTIRDGIRDTHILMKKPTGEAPELEMPGMTPTSSGNSQPAESSDDSDTEDVEEMADEEEFEDDEDVEDEPAKKKPAKKQPVKKAPVVEEASDPDDEWVSEDWE